LENCIVTLDAGLLRADEQARIDALDVEKSLIVQAPAGSGKTELLIQRYLRLLAIVDNPEEVVAITFTRKAAAEMKVRVLQALLRAQRSETPDEPHERVTAVAAEAALARDAMLGWQIIANPRRMRIQTLDSLNAAIARMQPVTGGASAANTVAGDAEMRALYRSAAAATLDWLAETGPVRDAVEDVLTHVDNNTGIYISYLARMLETRDQWLPFVGTGQFDARDDVELRKNLEDKLAAIVVQHLQQTRDAFPAELVPELLSLATYAARNLQDAGIDENPVSELDELQALPAAASESLHQWNAIVEFLMTRKGDLRKRVNKNQGFPPGDDGQKDRLQELLGSLAGHADLLAHLQWIRVLPPTRYGDDQWSVLLALFHLLPMAVAELQQLFSANGVTDYIEIALAADNALGTADDPGDIALLLDYQVRHILVDEMQDTSRAQYRMLEALTGGWQPGDGRTLFCVGDPMQSIYRFRNAEVAQFLLAQRKGIGEVQLEPLLLRQNFRSGEFLVHWFNTVFPLVLPEGAPEAEAEEGCRIIADTLVANPDESMAVLVRSRTQLSHLLPRLRTAGIAYQSVDIDRLTDLPEIIDVLALTRATVHPCDRLAWLAVLRSPWIGWDWSDLHSLVRNDAARTVWELLNDEDRLSQVSEDARQSLAAVRPTLESLFEVSRSGSLRDRIERAWLQLGGPAILEGSAAVENVYRFFDVLGRLEVAGSLHDVVELEAQLDLERVSTNVSARLQIMTMHRAKGLQFDHVLLYGLGRIPRSSERSVLSWFDVPDEHGVENKIISPVGRRSDVENDPIHRFIETADAQKDRHEFGRLLYVACTRARKSLHLLGHTGIASDGETIRPPHSRSLLSLLWPAIAPQYEAVFESVALPPSREDRDGWLLPKRSRIEPAWKLPDSSDVPGQRAETGGHENVTAVEYDWAGAEARVTGTIMHRWLQLAAESRVDLALEPADSLRATSERWLREAGVASGTTTTLVKRIENALTNIMSDPRGQWLLDGGGFAELALSGVIGNTIESGVIDRVRVDDDGTHWIVDYKSSTHEGGGLQEFLDAEARRYRDQLARYAGLQAFVEVRV
jgi:ATP-dependent exoDNAse (exonuclease V) beta subunit